MSVYKKFAVTLVGELATGEKFTHEFEFVNPKHVNVRQTAGYTESEVDGKTHYSPNGHGSFGVEVEY